MNNTRLQKLLEMNSENPQDTFVVYAIGMEYLGLNQFADAEQCFKDCLELDSNYISAYYQLGLLFQRSENDVQALLYLRKGLDLAKLVSNQKTLNEFKSLIEEIEY
jgi:tetratricopeptide (TPR) repeat protein